MSLTDAEKETEEEVAWSQKVDEYISTLKWDESTDEYTRTLVIGNIRGFAGWMRKQLMT